MTVAKIAKGLQPLATDISELTLLPGNPRHGDIKAIARILERFGQRKPITALSAPVGDFERGTVTAGNHTLLAARDVLGWPQIAVLWTDDDKPLALAWAAADNRSVELGTTDASELVDLLTQIEALDPELLEVAGYGAQDLAELLNSPAAEGVGAVIAPEEFAAYNEDVKTEHRCPSCGYEWSGGG